MKKLCIENHNGDEMCACAFCFRQVEYVDSYCPECGEKLGRSLTIDNIDDFREEIKKLDKKEKHES